MSEKSLDDTNTFFNRISGYINRFRNAVPWIVGALMALTAPLASTAFQGLIESAFLDSKSMDNETTWLYLSYFVLFAAAVYLMYRVTRWAYRPQTRFLRKDEMPEKRSNLLIFLSTSSCEKPENLDISGNIQKDLDVLESIKMAFYEDTGKPLFWNWEMPLRSIAHHLGTLERLTVICSSESIKQLPAFIDLIQPYIDNTHLKTYSIIAEDGINSWREIEDTNKVSGIEFEDFDSLSIELSRVLEQMRKNGIKDKQISIDFTSGQKVASIVAATLTYNRTIKAQYVSTKTLKVISYDVVYGTPKVPSLG